MPFVSFFDEKLLIFFQGNVGTSASPNSARALTDTSVATQSETSSHEGKQIRQIFTEKATIWTFCLFSDKPKLKLKIPKSTKIPLRNTLRPKWKWNTFYTWKYLGYFYLLAYVTLHALTYLQVLVNKLRNIFGRLLYELAI